MHQCPRPQQIGGRQRKSNAFNVTWSAFHSSAWREIRGGYLKANAGEGEYVAVFRSLEQLICVEEFGGHPSWRAHASGQLSHSRVSKASKSKVSDSCFPFFVN